MADTTQALLAEYVQTIQNPLSDSWSLVMWTWCIRCGWCRGDVHLAEDVNQTVFADLARTGPQAPSRCPQSSSFLCEADLQKWKEYREQALQQQSHDHRHEPQTHGTASALRFRYFGVRFSASVDIIE
ncbi:MAG: hypothetical protein ACK4UN_13920 [Limisphaerales bacterium]